MKKRKLKVSKTTWFLLAAFLVLFVWSGISPNDFHTWVLEVIPAVVALPILILTYKKFKFSQFAYIFIFIQLIILVVGGHYTYAQVPLFDWIKEYFGQDRNNYDKLAHLIQGVTPAVVTREILVRNKIVNGKGWLFFIVCAIGLSISAAYELVEMAVSILEGGTADAFLGTQGYVWDTQTDMLMALLGTMFVQLFFNRLHNKSMKSC